MNIKPPAYENNINIITPDWPAANNIRAFCTTRNYPGNEKDSRPTRNAALSDNTYDNFNLALHVQDDPLRVKANRRHLIKQFNLPHEPVWLDQVHGCELIDIANVQTLELTDKSSVTLKADASYSTKPNRICTILTADCIPVLICNKQGTKVAAAHAGWRGLGNGVIETAVSSLNEAPDEILVWLGPAIGADVFEVGEEVRDFFVKKQPESIVAFKQNRANHYLADMAKLARLRLQRLGIEAVYGGEYCTYTDQNRFYSFRRDVKTGRQASLIWFEQT
ncbi:FIG00003370: Multicopper polyphenol oxidase [hydrothermal vent metagenome]|uniref:FIG00003370: Multicopper polyphenol oxidase n=1 Tax=hydrothermal vent metagenome TaxID=652676 RepID=A0A3B0X212_9ZZZZ